MTTFGVAARRTGCAIAAFERPEVTGLERHDDLERLAARLRELAVERPGARFTIDLDQRGQALVTLLGGGPWRRYRRTGRERAELTTALDVALATRAFHVGRDVPGAADLARALAGVAKAVDEDGAPESELVVALALALLPRIAAKPRIW